MNAQDRIANALYDDLGDGSIWDGVAIDCSRTVVDILPTLLTADAVVLAAANAMVDGPITDATIKRAKQALEGAAEALADPKVGL